MEDNKQTLADILKNIDILNDYNTQETSEQLYYNSFISIYE